MLDIEKDATLFVLRRGKYKIKLYKPWIKSGWHCGKSSWPETNEWFVDIAILQIRKYQLEKHNTGM